MDSELTEFEAVIIGSGPTGLTLANLLGLYGVRTLVIERNETTVQEPRAVSIDDESLRTMQAAGVIDAVMQNVTPGYGSHYFGPDGSCFAIVEPTGTPFGYPRRNAFRQPVLEGTLRDTLARFPHVQTRFGWRLISFAQDAQGVLLTLQNSAGQNSAGATQAVTAQYLVGADGASSTVREQLGLKLEGTTFDERWLIVDLENHPNETKHTVVFCNTTRACITLPGPNKTRRFEFKLNPGDTDAKMLAPEMISELLSTHGALPGYTIKRQVIYRFHARVAPVWSRGRVFLAGDAAHLTPPFAGQGMNSGIRDAHNLAWKLAAVIRGRLGPKLLETYEQERPGHVWAMIRLALRMGRVMAPRSAVEGWLIRNGLRALSAYPPLRDYILQMKYKPKPFFATGFLASTANSPDDGLTGRLFPQPFVRTLSGEPMRLDDILGEGFALIAYGADAASRFEALASQAPLAVAPRLVAILPAGVKATRQADITSVWAIGGELDAIWRQHPGTLILLRPDRYVAALLRPATLAQDVEAANQLAAGSWADGTRQQRIKVES